MKHKRISKQQVIRWSAVICLGALSLYMGRQENYILMGALWMCIAPLV